jgi:hypothetical protein
MLAAAAGALVSQALLDQVQQVVMVDWEVLLGLTPEPVQVAVVVAVVVQHQ